MQYRSVGLLLILAPFVFSFAFALDIYVPIIPEMVTVFHTNARMVQLTLSLFMIVNGCGQLLIGPISDQIGRLKAILFSSVFFTLGSFLSAKASSIGMLILARMVCALGASGLLVTALAMIRDLFSGSESARMFSLINVAIGVSPTFAPIVGGYLSVNFGWSSVFWFLFSLGFLNLAVAFVFVKETHLKEKRIRVGINLFKRYFKLLTHREYISYVCLAGLGVSICFSFFSISSFIIIKLLQVPVEHFGFYFALFGLVIGFGGLFSAIVITKLGLYNTLIFGIILLFLGSALMFSLDIIWGLSLSGFMLSTVIACIGAVLLMSASAAAAMEPFPEIAGTAAAGLGCFQFVIAALVGSTMMLFPIHSSFPFASTIMIVAMLASMIMILMKTSSKI